MIAFDPQQIQPMLVAGLALDLAGAAILSKSFFPSNADLTAIHKANYSGGNFVALKHSIVQRLEARIGLAFLMFGFCLQILSSLGLSAQYLPLGLAFLLITAGHPLVYYMTPRWAIADIARQGKSKELSLNGWCELFAEIPASEIVRHVNRERFNTAPDIAKRLGADR